MSDVIPGDMQALVNNPAVKTVVVSFWYTGMEDGKSIHSYKVIGMDAGGSTIGSISVKSPAFELFSAFKSDMSDVGYALVDSYIDPRGGIEGGATYTRK